MPRQGTRKPKVKEDEGFSLKCKAALFTWNVQGTPDAAAALAELLEKPQWGLVKHYTICAEEEGHWHIHAFLEFSRQVDHLSDVWILWGVLPNIQVNGTTGSGFNTAVRRGSFYVANEYKKSFRSNVMNFYPAGRGIGESYAVKLQWIIDQWSQNKLRNPVECAGNYMCLTPSFKSMVSMTENQRVNMGRRAILQKRQEVLAVNRVAFKSYPIIDEFLKQFETEQFRYSFLWLSGESKLGKTELAKSLSEPYWHHRNSINWDGYDPSKHQSIIFDDCGDMESYILHHKMLFQASEVTTVNTSRTNCFALEVDTVGKKIIICSNGTFIDKWVEANCFLLQIREPTWVQSPEERLQWFKKNLGWSDEDFAKWVEEEKISKDF